MSEIPKILNAALPVFVMLTLWAVPAVPTF